MCQQNSHMNTNFLLLSSIYSRQVFVLITANTVDHEPELLSTLHKFTYLIIITTQE